MIPHLTWRSEFVLPSERGLVEFPQCAFFFCSKQEIQHIALLVPFAKLQFQLGAFASQLPADVRFVWLYKGDFFHPMLDPLVGEKVVECTVESPEQTVWFSVWGIPKTMWPLAAKFLEMYVDPKYHISNAPSLDSGRPRAVGRTVHDLRPADHINLFLKVVGHQ